MILKRLKSLFSNKKVTASSKKDAIVTLKAIKALKPCQDRLDNFIKFYGERSFTRGQFTGLKNITHSDKMWVAFRMMDKVAVQKAAIEIAKTVLTIYENRYPKDNRPRKAIETAEELIKNDNEENRKKARAYAANAAEAAAKAAAATYAANAAANAAAKAANAAYYAVAADADAAIYAVAAAYYAADAAYAATYANVAAANAADVNVAAANAADVANKARQQQEKLIRKIVLRYWR